MPTLRTDAVQEAPRRFIVDVEETMRIVLEQEDTDGNFQISITDSGPKVLSLGTATSNGYKGVDIRGTYMLSNLLQELAIAREHGRKRIVLDESRLSENPVDRLSRMISQTFWHNLTRRIDADGLEAILADPKNRSKSKNPRIYVPAAEKEMLAYYQKVASERPNMNLSVESLPPVLTADYCRDLNEKPGLLALAMRKEKDANGEEVLKGIPFIVPGARFNELYNWDSYFISLGLVVDGWVDMAKGICEHFVFNIKHYNKVLNGNRSYYLMRSQPPFLTDMALQVYSRLDEEKEEENKEWLRGVIRAAIKEYHTVWMAEPRLDRKTGLSRYRPEGRGVPPETEASHFTHVLRPYAEKHNCSVNEFTRKYNNGEIQDADLDEYFMHDRAVRESGHDTTYRFEKRCANLATIDLNALLYKYEVDIGTAIRELFDDHLELIDDFILSAPMPDTLKDQEPSEPSNSLKTPQSSGEWFARAAFRKKQVDKYCWNEGHSLYYDYDTAQEVQSVYETVTSFWALWSGLASEDQAARMIHNSLKKFEVIGGLVPGTEDSRGKISLDRPNRQWDYPFAWPPHQMLAWVGLERYGYLEEARRLAYRWCYMITVAVVDFNGCVPEKFDAVKLSHLVDAEYGNQGVDFKYVVKEGFGWTNSSFQVGLTFLPLHLRRALSVCQDPETLFGAL
jgi:alpha,alpha-trehalase